MAGARRRRALAQPNNLDQALGPRSRWTAALGEIDKHRDVWVAQLSPMAKAKRKVGEEMRFTAIGQIGLRAPFDDTFFGELAEAHRQLVQRVTKLVTDGHIAMADIALLLGNTRQVYRMYENRNKQLVVPSRPWAN